MNANSKVNKDNFFNYLTNLLDHMKTFTYGIYKEHNTWYIQSPENLEKSKLGVCHDFSLYAYYHLTKNGYNCKLMYLTNSSVTKTHSFVIITIHNKQYWFESAWGDYIGIHELKNGYKDIVSFWAKDENIDINDIAINSNVNTSELLKNKNIPYRTYFNVVQKPFAQGNENMDNSLFLKNLKKVNHLDKLDKLKLKTDEFIIGASASCILFGMPITNGDIDLCISKSAFARIKNNLYPGEKDGVHDDMYQDESGYIDINIEDKTNWFSWKEYYPLTIVVKGYRFLSYKGTIKFYQYLYDNYRKEKHLSRLNWLKEHEEELAIEELKLISFNNTNVDISLEAANDFSSKRKAIEDKIIKIVNTIDPSKLNENYYKELFSSMDNAKFTKWIDDIRNGVTKLYLFAPNLKVNIRPADALKAAEMLNTPIFEHLYFIDKSTGKQFRTPYKYMVLTLPIRRTRQYLMHKLSVAESDKKLDALTGQITGDDQASGISFPETELLFARGLNHTLTEFLKVRGGDIHAFAAFKQQLEENGSCRTSSLDPNTIPRSAVTMSSILKSMYIDNNLV